MIDERVDQVEQDSEAVSAVRGGDVERYRELVERHERRVFAVAWSRLGDAGLAEEATQEAFIRGYRRLWLLSDGAKFAGWIASIARRVAINLGLRHRRELNKRERWAVEQTAALETSDNKLFEPCSRDMLRQTLEELSASHRECLVLFYLEGKSGAEAATVMGISEAAFRVRVHRARSALREQLENKLEGSLQKLGPAKTLAPAVMAGVLVSFSGKATAAGGTVTVGASAKALSAFGKMIFLSGLLPFISVIGALPGLAFAWVVGRMERDNFRDAHGFRPQLHRQFFRSFVWGFPVVAVFFVVINHSAFSAWGKNVHELLGVCFLLVLLVISGRSLVILRHPFQIGGFAYGTILTVGTLALALGWLPRGFAQLPMLLGTLFYILLLKHSPDRRMDYSLFLRGAEGLLRFSGNLDETSLSKRFDRRSLLAFARFLGSRYLVNNFRFEKQGLALRLPPVKAGFLASMALIFMPPISRGCSHIVLGYAGTVSARCGKGDANDLATLTLGKIAHLKELENLVAEAIAHAWRSFCDGQVAAAERTLGQLRQAELFMVSPTRAKAIRWMQFFLSAGVVVMLLGMTVTLVAPRLSSLKPVSVTEAQVMAFLNDTTVKIKRPNSARAALASCLVLPSTNLFTSQALGAIRDEIAGTGGFDKIRTQADRAQWIINAAPRALAGRWLSWSDLGIDPKDSAVFLRRNSDNWAADVLISGESWSRVKPQRYSVMRIWSDGVAQLKLFQEMDCLDLIDREKLIQQIASVQVVSARPSPGQPPIHDWRAVRGLFVTPGWPTLQDTYFSLAALEILGGLDRIDREQCIRGILLVHRGKGFFRSPSEDYNESNIAGDARDTIAAFESLRLLGGLDRVKDLERWQFRPQRHSELEGQLTWSDVEAWVCQRRLEKIARQWKAQPHVPARSLLQE